MIDVQKEISKHHPAHMGGEIEEKILDFAISRAVDAFAKEIQRLGKFQFKTGQQLEEVIALLEEEKELSDVLREYKNRIKAFDEERESMFRSIMILGDALEDVYRYVLRSESKEWIEQLEMVWKNAGEQLAFCGISRVEGTGQPFNPEYQTAVKVEDRPGFESGQVLEVIRSGYLYRGAVVRKAEVIVNKITQEDF